MLYLVCIMWHLDFFLKAVNSFGGVPFHKYLFYISLCWNLYFNIFVNKLKLHESGIHDALSEFASCCFFLRISVTLTYRETHNRILKIGGSSKTDLPSALKDIQHGFKRNWKCWLSTVTVAEDVAPVMPTNPSMQTTTAAVCVCPQIRQVSQKHNTLPIHYSNIIKSSALTFSISIRLNDISKHALFSCWKQPSVDAVFINGWSAKLLM